MTDISIITATYNAETTIKDCLRSVNGQQDIAVEHILIDGGSTDRTVEIAQEYGHLSHIVSEPDDGIYDAMNKGINLASSDIIGILNADDFYNTDQVLATVVDTFNKHQTDTCYGDLQYVADQFREAKGMRSEGCRFKTVRYWRAGEHTPRGFYWGWMPPHPTFFVKREVYERCGLFNLQLGSAGDYELMLRFLVKHHLSAAYIPQVLVQMRTGGVSNVSVANRMAANRMDKKAWQVNDLRPYPWTMFMKPVRKISQWFIK